MRWAVLILGMMAMAALAQDAPKKKKPAEKKQTAQQAHKKPTPEQIRKFNELEKKQKQ